MSKVNCAGDIIVGQRERQTSLGNKLHNYGNYCKLLLLRNRYNIHVIVYRKSDIYFNSLDSNELQYLM